jgi:serine/threonine-protein phosphatase 2A regulatory subunit B'
MIVLKSLLKACLNFVWSTDTDILYLIFSPPSLLISTQIYHSLQSDARTSETPQVTGSNPPSSSTTQAQPPANNNVLSQGVVSTSSQDLSANRQQSRHTLANITMASSNQLTSPASAMRELPALRDTPPANREELFILKLQLCSVIFSFDDQTSDKRGKDMKRQTLLELVDYVNTPAGQKIFTESVMGDLMACVSANVCRALPPATDDFDPEEDEPVLEPAWPHLQVAYEFFLRFIVSSEVNAKAAKKYVDQRFCLQLVELFDSEDPRERDYLKTILHRIYGKFMSHRSFIRRAISNVFYRFVYETERHNGIGELLEILGSIINGFAIPLKKEHLQFLVRALIPLHKPKCVSLYHQQLSYCIIQYVEKDADTAAPILNGFFKCWPWSCSQKQVLFLNELEEILELLGAEQLAQISKNLFTNLARCLDSEHFQVVERALFLWNNEHLVNSGCLSRLNAEMVLPIIYGPLYKNSSGHWNATVEGLAQNVLKMYMEYDLVLYDKCTTAYFKDEEEAKRKIEAISERWSQIEEMAQENSRRRMITAN